VHVHRGHTVTHPPRQIERLLPHPLPRDVLGVVLIVHSWHAGGARVKAASVGVCGGLQAHSTLYVAGARGAVADRAKRGVLLRRGVTHHAHRHSVEAVATAPRLAEKYGQARVWQRATRQRVMGLN